jgi:hypothetical protein
VTGTKKRKDYVSIGLMGLALAFLSTACATVDYLAPSQGTSSELQTILARSLDDQIKMIPFDPRGKTVDIQVRAWGSYRNPFGLEGYLQSLLREWVVQKGGRVGSGDLRLVALLPVLGDTATRRDLSYQNIPLYYSEQFDASLQLFVFIREADGKPVATWQGKHGTQLSDAFIMRFFGPLD